MIRVIRLVGVGDEEVPKLIEEFITEAKEITKAKVQSLGGNFLLGLKIDINTLEVVQNQLYILISLFGDVVYAEMKNKKEQKEGNSDDEV